MEIANGMDMNWQLPLQQKFGMPRVQILLDNPNSGLEIFSLKQSFCLYTSVTHSLICDEIPNYIPFCSFFKLPVYSTEKLYKCQVELDIYI